MATILRSIPATVAPDGTVTLDEPLELSASVAALVTIAVETTERTPNAETVAAMEECLAGLPGQPRFDSVETLMEALASSDED